MLAFGLGELNDNVHLANGNGLVPPPGFEPRTNRL